jgi:hypothetical protein
MKLPRRDVSPGLRRRRYPHAGRSRSGRRCPVPGHQQTPRPKRVGAGYPLLDDRGNQSFQHQSCAAQAKVRDPPVRGSNRRVPRHEIRSVVVGAQQRGQHLEELRRSASPRDAVRGVRCRAPDPRCDGSGGQEAGSPDAAVTRDLEARIPGTPAQWRQSVPEAGRPGECDSARVLHPITLLSLQVTASCMGRAD